ncbi:MAG TPA: serpin family protein, partial [Gemmatimonadaceae bacterium]|nr:serpin family protein [Gemmatimonadaceae bacterium]
MTSAEQQTVASGNAFTFSLFHQVVATDPGDNIFLSPLSASMSFGMAMNGAKGATLDGMRTALSLGSATLPDIDAGYKGVIDLLEGLDPTTTFRLANSIWYADTTTPSVSFVDTTEKWFDATVQPLNFNDAAGSLTKINGWVNTNTNGAIPTILDQFPSSDVMLLINAIDFKGQWQVKFDPGATAPGGFLAADGSTQIVPFMNRDEHVSPEFRVGQASGATMLELPYGGGAFVMDFLTPVSRSGPALDSLAMQLTPTMWAALVASLQDTDAALSIPKFTLSYERTLNDDLSALGAGIAFSTSADLAGIFPGLQTSVDFVKQKTFVDVDESGTEAGASTVTGVVPVSLTEYSIHSPFIVAIRERQSNTIL